jgi:hypothetical protein
MIDKVLDLAMEADQANDFVLSLALLNVARTMKLKRHAARNFTNSQTMMIELLEEASDLRSETRRTTHPAPIRP